MIVKFESMTPIDFNGLEVFDYTADKDLSSSLALIRVPPGIKHPLSWSTRSDKYYLVISGAIYFRIDGKDVLLRDGDMCVIPKGQRFFYENRSDNPAKMVLLHTPSFKIEAEVFEDTHG